jgi:glutathione S-transferase
MARTRVRINATFDELESRWLNGLQHVSAGSIAVAVTLAYIDFRLGDLGWRQGRPRLAAWHADFSRRESMEKTSIAGR